METKELVELKKKLIKYTPKTLLRYEVSIVDHCNLNCRGCYHFSPLVKEKYLDTASYEKDCKRLAELCDNEMSNIGILGGEPLLHPNICDFLRITRENFPVGRIWILTNGILLSEMSQQFWKCCQQYRIDIQVTRYPLPNLDYDALGEKVKMHGLKYYSHNNVELGEKTLIKYPFDLSGEYDPNFNFYNCFRANGCVTLREGRLYTCVMAENFYILNDHFNLGVHLSDKNGIDIYKAKSWEEIAQFLCKPIPFCRYCALDVKPQQFKWQPSKKLIEEWI